ncbi:hypothetical protein GBAR_LOCUS12584, partial [Geodia barretti]
CPSCRESCYKQQECPDLLRSASLFSETHSPAKIESWRHCDWLGLTRNRLSSRPGPQLRSRETGDGDGRAHTGTVRLRCWLWKGGGYAATQQLISSLLLSSTSTMLLEESGSRSILRRIADLAPVLSQEAHIVNQLSKNKSVYG